MVGWHSSMIHYCLMHTLHLGILHHVNGGVLLCLMRLDFFGTSIRVWKVYFYHHTILALSVVFNSWPYISAMLLHPVSQATQVRPQSSMSSLKHWASASAGGWLPMLFRCLVEIKKTDQGFDPLVDVLVSLQTCMGSIHGNILLYKLHIAINPKASSVCLFC